MTTAPYVYPVVRVDQVVDGDTFDLVLDVGFHLHATVRCRLLGYDTPELHHGSSNERARGQQAKAITAAWFGQPDRRYWVRTEKDPDSFGRWLADTWSELGDDVSRLGDVLSTEELATMWPTRWREVYDPPDAL
jgi:micrococcal nuclease